MILYGLIQTIYWLALSTWFGGVLFVALMAQAVVRTIGEFRPMLPTVLSVNLENQHASVLSGAVVGNMLRKLSIVQLVCAVVALVMLLGHFAMVGSNRVAVIDVIARGTLLMGTLGVVLYDRYILWPKLWSARQMYLDNADNPDVANPAKEEFDRAHHESVSLLFICWVLLGLLIALSATITPKYSDAQPVKINTIEK
jgi:hypothetical protein